MLILSFYGAGFRHRAGLPADLFGTFEVGAIHGRLLTAWSVAGVLARSSSTPSPTSRRPPGCPAPLYVLSFDIMIGLLIVGFICNELIKPVDPKFHEPAGTASLGRKGGLDSDRLDLGDLALTRPHRDHRGGLAVGIGALPVRRVAAADQGGAAVQRLTDG